MIGIGLRYVAGGQVECGFTVTDVAVASPPEAGQANKALCTFLADQLGIRKSAVTVESGHTCPIKTVGVQGVEASQIRNALALD